jgi:quercetin dioxygenase-like cupin family protein
MPVSKFPEIELDNGSSRQVLSDSPELMMVSFRFTQGSEGAPHSHRHVQSTYVAAGRFRFTIEGESFEVGPGDSFVIPSNAVHGCICLEAGQLVDCFTPRRDDFL